MPSISFHPQTPADIRGRETVFAHKSTFDGPTFAVYTLGCKVNQADSNEIARVLQSSGFRQVPFRQEADLYVIDTCTVTSEANRKSRKAAARAQRNNPDGLVAVTGCAASFAREQFRKAAPQALVLGNDRKFELPQLAIQRLQENQEWAQRYADLRQQTASEPMPVATRERGVIKVQDGCNHRCSFCIIPTVRGGSVQKSLHTIIERAKQLIDDGTQEITITGVSLGDWGREAHSRKNGAGRNAALCQMLRQVAELEGLHQLRVSSLDPSDVDEEFLQTIAGHPKICSHIHLALQSGAASTLRRMRRRYTPELYRKWALRWREICPDGALTTDVIVGFPGETEEEFEESMEMARAVKFSAMHVFPYSPREGTAAAELGDFVDPAIQKDRVARLISLGQKLSEEYGLQFVGKVLSVLVEKVGKDGAEGQIPQYVKTHIANGEHLKSGNIAQVRIEKAKGRELFGSCV